MALFSKEPEKGLKVQPAQPYRITNSLPTALASGLRAQSGPPEAKGTRVAEEPACLSRGSKVSGKLAFGGSARIDGEVDGEITAKDRLYIGRLAIVTAQIKAASIIVAGKVSGDITGSQKIEIRPSAKVSGKLSAPVLIVQEGARFEGQCSMPEAAREDRKATPFPKEERVEQVAQAMSR